MARTLYVTFALGLAIGFSLCYALVVALGGWGTARTDGSGPTVPPQIAPVQPSDSPYAGAADLEFALDIWAARHLLIALEGTRLDAEAKAFLAALRPGGVVLQDANFVDREQTAQFVEEIKAAVGFGTAIADPPLIAVYPESGQVDRFGDGPLATAATLGAEGDASATRQRGRAFGQACLSRGISMVFAPVLDVYEPGSAVPDLARTAYGASQGVVTTMGLAFADGIMAAGVIPVAKHYPGMGAARRDPATGGIVIDRDVPELAELMYPFAEAAAQRIPGILVGHAAVPVLEKDAPNTPASASTALVGQVLRQHWGFRGVVVADDMAAGQRGPVGQAVVAALTAGCDTVILLDPDPQAIHAVCVAVEDAVREERLAPAVLEAAKRRLDGLQHWLREPQGLAEQEALEAPGEAAGEPAANAGPAGGPEEVAAATDPAAERPPNTVKIEHIVEPGDTIENVAAKCGVAPDAVVQWNRLEDDTLTPGTKLVVYAPLVPDMEKPSLGDPELVRQEHRVQAGEALFGIAEEYGVTVLDLLRWNGLSDAEIQEGQTLTVYLPAEAGPRPANVAPTEEPLPPLPSDQAETPLQEDIPLTTHRITRGESLGSIAARYGTTRRRLIELNNLSNPNKILYGQELKVPERP